jgi:hypothetical protein
VRARRGSMNRPPSGAARRGGDEQAPRFAAPPARQKGADRRAYRETSRGAAPPLSAASRREVDPPGGGQALPPPFGRLPPPFRLIGKERVGWCAYTPSETATTAQVQPERAERRGVKGGRGSRTRSAGRSPSTERVSTRRSEPLTPRSDPDAARQGGRKPRSASCPLTTEGDSLPRPGAGAGGVGSVTRTRRVERRDHLSRA